MKRQILIALAALATMTLSSNVAAQEYSWKSTKMDASRTGVTVPAGNNTEKALGKVKGRTYYAPNGRVFRRGCIADVARCVMEAQPVMAPVKKVIGHSPAVMSKHAPESPLSNFAVDVIMKRTAAESGKKVDCGIINFGGIRVDMPKGDILVDDIMSMFPFKNTIVYMEVKGSDLRKVLEWMASTKIQVVGGMKLVIKDRTLVSAEIGGEPLEDNRTYSLATISFLLHGGDGLFLGDIAHNLVDYPVDIYDVIHDYVVAETAAGRDITGSVDGRVVIL